MAKQLPVSTVVPGGAVRQLSQSSVSIVDTGFTFSFRCFSRNHKLFNLGGTSDDKTVGGSWFIELFDALKSINGMTAAQMKLAPHELHPVDMGKTNANIPPEYSQHEFWQFRLDKSSGRVIGILLDRVFYVVWLDPHHNLTDSEGYGGIKYFKQGLSSYEKMELQLANAKAKILELEEDLAAAEELLNER